MAPYVLVHGAWHGAWCWRKVIPGLQERGHTVRTVDLPGHGEDDTPISEVTLEAYAARVSELVERLAASEGEGVVLVGHSMGGLAVTQAAEAVPDAIAQLIYLTAFLLPTGATLMEAAESDAHALVLPNLEVDEARGAATLPEHRLREIFYADCPEEDVLYAKSRLVPQALAPFATPLNHTEANFGRVPRSYIECTEDRAISLSAQRRMHGDLPCGRVETMESSHSPFFSRPEELAELLHEMGGG